jgi:hypothetical protein
MSKTRKKKSEARTNGGSNGAGMYEDFTPDRTSSIAGFWKPTEKGESIEGVLVEKAEGRNSDYFVFRVTKPIRVVSRDRNTDEEIVRTAEIDREVGVSCWASLRGLERYSGHHLIVTILGKEREKGTNGEMITKWKTHVRKSKQIIEPSLVYIAPLREPKRGFSRPRPPARQETVSGPSSDDDIPF